MSLDFDVKSGDFEAVSFRASRAIESALVCYLAFTKKKTFEEMALYFKELEIDASTICAKKMVNVGAWRCKDCAKTDNTIFCQECWSKMREKHKDHDVIFLSTSNGTCDCGDHNMIDKEYFCPDHIGIFENEQEINGYILESLGQDLTFQLTTLNKKFFDKIAEYIIRAINDKKTETISFTKVMNEFVTCFGILCNLNTACCYIISNLLLHNYAFKTKHTCIQITDKGMKIKQSSLFAHDCTCPFIRLILQFWPVKKELLLYKLIGYYQLKKVMGLYYFLLYGNFFKDNITEIQDMSVQIIFDDVLNIACKVPGLIDNMFESMIEIFEIFLKKACPNSRLGKSLEGLSKNKKFEIMKEVVLQFKCDVVYLTKKSTLSTLSNNSNILCKIIKLACRLHNANTVEAILPRPKTDKEFKYIMELLDVELWLLDIFALLVSIFNFDDINLVKTVFAYFSKKILERENSLKDNEYTFHIPLYRAFSIFLNRYCFHEANKTNTHILQSLQNVMKLMPDFKKCSKIMIKSIYKVFGFITACEEGFFSYYGTSMGRYEYVYYYNFQFIYRDFCLFKYLIALKENAKYIDFKQILSLCQVENSHEIIDKYILNKGKVVSPDLWLNESNKKYLKFSSKILYIILSILRNNTCLIWNLSSGFNMLKMNKIEDKLLNDILSKDKNNFSELTKELIINQILIKENLALYTDISDSIFPCLKDFFGQKYITDLIISLTNKTLTKEKKAKFAIKDEYLYYLDLNYIIYPMYKSTSEKYISDFKSKIVSIFNVHFYPDNKFEAKLTEENYNQLYFNDANFDFLFQFTEFILTQKGYEILTEYFLSVLLNYLSTFLCVDNDHFIFLRENLSTNHVIEVLEKNNLNDEVKKSYCQFIVNKMKAQNESGIIVSKISDKNKFENNVQPVAKSSKMSLKEKMKNKYKEKNNNLVDKLGVDKIVIEEKKSGEACIYCLKPIDPYDISKPYGAIGDFLCDNLMPNAFFQEIRKEYKKYYDADETLPAFDLIYFQPNDRKTIKIISCNHYIHFTCFFKQFMKSNLYISLAIYACPLCHRLNETCVPMLTQYNDEQTFGYFRGFNITELFEYGKTNLELYETKLLEDDKKKIAKKEEEISEEGKEEPKEIIIPKFLDSEEIKKANENFRQTYPDFVNLCKHFIEGFLGMRAGIDIVNLEDKILKPIIAKYTTAIAIQFRDLVTYLNNIEDKNYSIMLWKDLILSLRLMFKLDLMMKESFFLSFYRKLNEMLTYKFSSPIQTILQLDSVRLRTFELLLALSLFFDYEQIEGYEKYIMHQVLPIYAFGFFFKNIYFKTSFLFRQQYFLEHLKSEEMYQFLNQEASLNLILNQVVEELVYTKIIMNKNINANNLSLKLDDNLDLLNLPSLKGKTLLQVLDELDKLIELDSTNEKMKFIYDNFKSKYNYKELFQIILDDIIESTNKKQCDDILSPSLLGSCLPNKFTFIELPALAIDFEYLIYNIGCMYCKAKGRRALICLDCGRKVCDSRACVTDFKGEKLACFFVHTKICGGGRCAFLQSDNCSVLFITHKAVFRKFLPLYVNEFGEGISKTSFGKEFKLNKEEVNNALKIFMDYSYSNAEIV